MDAVGLLRYLAKKIHQWCNRCGVVSWNANGQALNYEPAVPHGATREQKNFPVLEAGVAGAAGVSTYENYMLGKGRVMRKVMEG